MKVLQVIKYAFAKHSRYCVVGGGSGGLNLTTHLLRSGIPSHEIRVIDPSEQHFYQPGWTMVGAGLWQPTSTVQSMDKTFPSEIKILRQAIKHVKPN